MVKKIYNVVLQSEIGDGLALANDTYFYDWSLIPDVPYYLTFSFASSVGPITQFAQMAMLYVDLAQSNNQLAKPQSSAQFANRSQFLGNLMYAVVGTNNYLYAENNTNPPTYLNGRPQSNNFIVEIHSTPTADFIPFAGVYSLILSFQEC